MKRLAMLGVVLALAACSQVPGPEAGAVGGGYSFTVDPQAGTVEVATVGGAVLGVQQVGEARALEAGTDLAYAPAPYFEGRNFSLRIVQENPGESVLEIETRFRNTTTGLAFSDLTFEPTVPPAERTYLFSQEASTGNALGEGDGDNDVLSPGERTESIYFVVAYDPAGGRSRTPSSPTRWLRLLSRAEGEGKGRGRSFGRPFV